MSDKIEELEQDIEELENSQCSNIDDCPFGGEAPKIKSLADQERFDNLMEEYEANTP